MQQEYNFNSLFDNTDRFKNSFTNETVKLHIFYNTKSSNEEAYNESDDRYKGFFSSYCEEQVKQRTTELGYEDRAYLTREALFDNAAYQLKNTLITSTDNLGRKVFKIFETDGLFNNPTEDQRYSNDLLNEFATFLINPRDVRENEDVLPSLRQIDYQLDSMINRSIAGSVSATANIRRDITSFMEKAYSVPAEIDLFTGGSYSRSQKLLQQSGYVSRPGILPAIGIIHDAGSSLDIDIFQLQNTAILDYATDNILRRVHAFREETAMGGNPDKFILNIRLAYPGEGSEGTTYDILGMNAITARRFERLKEMGIGEAVEINLFYADRKNHPKFLVSDNTAIIGSQNLTNPVGKSLNQAGSNYEALRILQFKSDIHTPESLVEEIRQGKDSKDKYDSETTLFLQSKIVMNRIMADPTGKFLSTGQKNVGGPVETMELLRSSLDYADSKKGRQRNTKISAILDQVFLLQYEPTLFNKVKAGEMGPEALEVLNARESYISKKAGVYQGMQTQFLNMLIEGRANTVVDVRNYREKVQDPLFIRLNEVGIMQQYGYNLDNLIRESGANKGTAEERIRKLSNTLSSYGLDEKMARQILAVASDNIVTSIQPRQHVKSFLTYEGNLIRGDSNFNDYSKFLSGTLGSSNFGLYSLGLADNEIERVITNFEMNLVYASEEIRNHFKDAKNVLRNFDSAFSLDKNKETEELKLFASQFFRMISDLQSRKVGQLEYSNVNNRAEYERDVDRTRLMELYNRLKDLKTITGGDMMAASLQYDARGPIALQIKLSDSLKPYEFTVLNNGSGQKEGFVYNLNSHKIIGLSEFVNNTQETLTTGFKRDGEKVTVRAGQRMEFSPIETTLSLLSSIALEGEQIRLIRAPLEEYRSKYAPGIHGNIDFLTGISRYLLTVAGHKGKNMNNILEPGAIGRQDLVYGALKNIQIRLQTSNRDLNRIRTLAGIDINSSERQATLTQLSQLMEIYGKTNREGRIALITGQGLEGRPSLYSFLSNLLNRPEYADLLYDFIQAQDDPLYRRDVTTQIKEVSNRAFDPYLLRTQANSYGYSQAYRQKVLYGINKRRVRFRDKVNESVGNVETNLTRLGAYALASSPYEHNATTPLGKGEAVHIGVAEGSGSTEVDGAFNAAYNNYAGLLPYAQHKKIGDVSSLRLLEDAGVGFILSAEAQEEYRRSIEHLGSQFSNDIMTQTLDTIDKYGVDNQLLLFKFDVSKKASQIPQRIKNVKGSRPLLELSVEYQSIVDRLGPTTYQARFGGQTREVGNSVELQQAYLEDLRKGIGANKADLIHEGYNIGSLYSGQLNPTLGHDAAIDVELIRAEIEKQFGVDTKDQDIGTEIFRNRLLQLDTQASANRGFIGSSKRYGESVMLFQLGGAFSDYSFLNPYYGGEEGIRQGYVDRAVKGQLASKLVEARLQGGTESWNFFDNLKVASGDVIALDYEKQQVQINRYDAESKEYKAVGIVDSRKEFQLLTRLLDKTSSNPNFDDLRTTSNAASFTNESAREIIRELRILEGNPNSNEIRIEMVYDRTILPGTRRLESMAGGLLKLNPIFLYGDFFENIVKEFNQNRGGSFSNYTINSKQVMGIVNPSNLKSYFYSHGATILTQQNGALFSGLLNGSQENVRALAASLLMGFGTDRFGNNQLSPQALEALVTEAQSGRLGEYYKDQATLAYLQKGIEQGGAPSLADVGETFIKGTAPSARDAIYKKLQVRTLEYIGLDTIIAALTNPSQDGGLLIEKLRDMFKLPSGEIVRPEYLDIGTDRGRELALLAGTLDLFGQMSRAKVGNIPVLNAVADDTAYKTLGSIGGLSFDDLMNDKDKLSNLVNSLATRTYTVGLFLSAAASMSKVAMSSKKESFIETQHIMWEPFTTNLNKFSEGGTVGSLRNLIAGFFGAATGAYTGEFIKATQQMQVLDILEPYVRNPLFKAKMMGIYSSPLLSEATFSGYKQEYEMFGLLHMLVNSDGFKYSAKDKHVIESIVRAYRKNDKDSQNELLDELVNKKSKIGAIRNVIESGLIDSIRRFEKVQEEFKYIDEREPGMGLSESTSSGLQRTAGKQGRFGFSIPMMEFLSDGRVRFYKQHKEYSMSLAGEDTKMLGEAFGGFESELLKQQAVIWNAFAEGSLVGRVFDTVAQSTDQIVELDLNEESYMQLMQFRETAVLYTYAINEALASSHLQKIFGNKIGFSGGTTTPSAMFLGSNQAAILPQALLERLGNIKPNTNRQAAHRQITTDLVTQKARLTPLVNAKESVMGPADDSYREQLEDLTSYKDETISSIKEDYKQQIDTLKEHKEDIKESILHNNRYKRYLEKTVGYLGDSLTGFYNTVFVELDKRYKELDNSNKAERYPEGNPGDFLHAAIQRKKSLINQKRAIRRQLELGKFVLSTEGQNRLLRINETLEREINKIDIEYYENQNTLKEADDYAHYLELMEMKKREVEYWENTYTRPIVQEIATLKSHQQVLIEQNNQYKGSIRLINRLIGNKKNEKKAAITSEVTFFNALKETLKANKERDTIEYSSQLKAEYKARKFLQSGAYTLQDGISSAATYSLKQLVKKSSSIQERIGTITTDYASDISRLKEINMTMVNSYDMTLALEKEQIQQKLIKEAGIGDILTEIEGQPSLYPDRLSILSLKRQLTKEGNMKGDAFINLLSLYELETLRGELLGLVYSSKDGYKGKYVSAFTIFAETFKNVPTYIQGLRIGSNVDNNGRMFIAPEELKSEIKPGANKLIETLGITQEQLAKFSDVEAEHFVRRGVKAIKEFSEQREAYLMQEHSSLMTDTMRGRFKALRKSLGGIERRLDNRQLDANGILGDKQDLNRDQLNDIVFLLENEVQNFHTELNLGRAQSNRPSPLGSPYLNSGKVDIFPLQALNESFANMGLPITFTPLEGQFNRNATLHLANPMSWLQSQLGDFDGDTIINIMDTSHNLKFKREAHDTKISHLKEERSRLQIRRQDAEYYGNGNVDTIDAEIEKITNTINTTQAVRDSVHAMIGRVENQAEYKTFQQQAAKYVGNYLKTDYRMFLSKDNGGWAKEDVDPSVLFTFIEQGRGLFGGLEDLLIKGNEASAVRMYEDFNRLAQHKASLNTADDFNNLLGRTDHQDNKLYELLRSDSDVRENVRIGLIAALGHKDGQQAGVAEFVGNLYAAQSSTEQIQKFSNKGLFGTAMSPDTFQGMLNTLGQAGSIILGKTYNTMQGMLFTESPTLALSYAILNDPNGELEGIIHQMYGPQDGARKVEEMKQAAHASRSKSEQMGAFLQATQQILRDSIKPKQAEKYLSELDAAIDNHKEAKLTNDKETIDKTYNELVQAFGPGSGLRSLMQMEYLIKDLHVLREESEKEGDIIKKEELIKKYELTEDRMSEYLKRLGYDEKTGFADDRLNKLGIAKEAIVAAYKTKQDLVSMVSAFAFEKAMAADVSKGDHATSTGRGVISLFTSTMRNHEDFAKWEGIVQNTKNFFSNPESNHNMNEENAAYIDALKQQGIDHDAYSGMTEAERLYHIHSYLTTSKQLEATTGVFGEKLITHFVPFNKQRSVIYGGQEDREAGTSFDITQDPLAVAEMMAATSGKIDPSTIGKAMSALVNTTVAITGNPNPSMDEVVTHLLGSGSLNETPDDRKMVSMFLEIAKADKKAFEYLIKTTSAMAFGQQASTIKNLATSAAYENANNGMSEENLKQGFIKKGFDVETAERIAGLVHSSYLQGINTPDAVQTLANQAIRRDGAPIREPKAISILGGLGHNADVKSNAFIFPLLGLIGQAIASGDLTPEGFQQAVGMTISNLSYLRYSNLQENWKGVGIQGLANVAAGTGFKMRLALEENQGDAGKALLELTAREVTMGTVATITSHALSEAGSRLFKGVESLNFNKYESTKNVLTNVGTMIAATLAGMFAGNTVSQIVNPQTSFVASELKAIVEQNQKTTMKMNDQVDPDQEDFQDVPVEGDAGQMSTVAFATWSTDEDIKNRQNTDSTIQHEDYVYAYGHKLPEDFIIDL